MINFQNCVFRLRRVNEKSVVNDMAPLFIQGEELIGVYKTVRDYVVFRPHV